MVYLDELTFVLNMYLTTLKLTNFRHYQNLKLDFPEKLTILVGPNASGKTNLLEAIQMLSFSKSFRTRSDLEVIRWGMDFCRVDGEVKTNDETQKLELVIDTSSGKLKKNVKINSVPKRTLDLIGELPSVLFCPEDLDLIVTSPYKRRRYLDMVLCQVSKRYWAALSELRKVLMSRNQILKDIVERKAEEKELDFWDLKLIETGKLIMSLRKGMIDFFNTKLVAIYNQITKEDKYLKMIYKPSLTLPKEFSLETIASKFKDELGKIRHLEIKKQRTLVGPHRDDFYFLLDKKSLATFGSRGEFRSVIIAMKMVEVSFLEEKLGQRPILLLDDVFSELDQKRRNSLASIIGQQQTIITTTDISHLDKTLVEKAKVIRLPM